MYTSSAAACIVSPFTVLYAATKAFLSAFGAGLAAEVRHKGIDVLAFHPSPVATRFYDKVRGLGLSVIHSHVGSSPPVGTAAAGDINFVPPARLQPQDYAHHSVPFGLT